LAFRANKIAILARFVKIRAILWRDNGSATLATLATLAGPVTRKELP
jgi:hypothetical protein